MSGGRWGYQQHAIEMAADYMRDALMLLAELEHDVDWSESCDTGREETEEMVYDKLVQFFDAHSLP